MFMFSSISTFLFTVLIYLGTCLIVNSYARKKGRSGTLFFLLSLLFTPFIGIILVLIEGPNIKKMEAKELREGNRRKCPHCKELVTIEAVICKHCHLSC